MLNHETDVTSKHIYRNSRTMFKGIDTQDKKRSRDVNKRERENKRVWGERFCKGKKPCERTIRKKLVTAGMFIQLLVIQFLNLRGN